MACSGSLAPHFVNNDYVTAEIIHSTEHVRHEVYVTAEITIALLKRVMRYSLGQGVLCAIRLCKFHLKKLWSVVCGYVALYYRCCLQFQRLLESLSSLLACSLVTLGSANSVDSEIQWDNRCHEQNHQYIL